MLGPSGPAAADHVERGRGRRAVYVGRGDLADLLTRALGPPQPDPHLLHDLVQISLVEAVPAAHLPNHRAEPGNYGLDGDGEMMLGFGAASCRKYRTPGVGAPAPPCITEEPETMRACHGHALMLEVRLPSW